MVSTDLHTVLPRTRSRSRCSATLPRTTVAREAQSTDGSPIRPRDGSTRKETGPQSRSFVADLRAAVGRRSPGDADVTELVEDLAESQSNRTPADHPLPGSAQISEDSHAGTPGGIGHLQAQTQRLVEFEMDRHRGTEFHEDVGE